jgi:predicted nicotinamide N-methyase
VILREPWPSAWTTPGAEQPEVLELGCGLGLPGVTALSCGLRVVFSDYDLTAMRFAAANAVRNGHSRFRLLPIDWTQPPTDFRVPLILASDLTFERRHVAPIVALLKRVLLPGGVCLLTDQDRLPAADLRAELHHAGLPYTKQLVRAGVPGGERFKGTLYRITRE